jgi:hypothetical protein
MKVKTGVRLYNAFAIDIFTYVRLLRKMLMDTAVQNCRFSIKTKSMLKFVYALGF